MSRHTEIIAETVEKIFSLAHTSLDVDGGLAGFTDQDWAKVAKWEKHLRNSFTRYYENELQTARQKALACTKINTREGPQT